MDKVNDQNPSDKIEGEVNLSSGQEVQPEVKPQIENQPGLSSPPPPWAAAGAAVGSGEEKVKVLDGVDSETPAVREVKEPIFKKLIPLIGALVLLLVLFL